MCDEYVPYTFKFGRLDLYSKKNRNRLDKYCTYTKVKVAKCKRSIRIAVPPTSKEYRKKQEELGEYTEPVAITTEVYIGRTPVEGTGLETGTKYIDHCIGRVGFYQKTEYGAKYYRKKACKNWPVIQYQYKPRPYIPYQAAPTHNMELADIVWFQKAQYKLVLAARVWRTYEYLTETHVDLWDQISLICLTTDIEDANVPLPVLPTNRDTVDAHGRLNSLDIYEHADIDTVEYHKRIAARRQEDREAGNRILAEVFSVASDSGSEGTVEDTNDYDDSIWATWMNSADV
jgi:hypothetical protein